VSLRPDAGVRCIPRARTVRRYLRYGLSCPDVERGVEVDHVTVYRWVQRFAQVRSAARYSVAMSIFFICSIAPNARAARSRSGSAVSSSSAVGTICQDSP
jgi:hypothetical protein